MAQSNQDRVDLSSVNQRQKSKKTRIFSSLFSRKRAAGPGRDAAGRFSSGTGGLKLVKKFNWGRALPLILIVSAVGGYLVYRSFAGTYSDCKEAISYQGIGTQDFYATECVTSSDEAIITRLYLITLDRYPDKGGYEYWLARLSSNQKTPEQIANSMIRSGEFKRAHGRLTNEGFVKVAYQQAFGRTPAASIRYWTKRLNAKTVTPGGVIAHFVQHPEIVEKFKQPVAGYLGIRPDLLAQPIKGFSSDRVTCHGAKVSVDGEDVCRYTMPKQSTDRFVGRKVVMSVNLEGVVKSGSSYFTCFISQGQGQDLIDTGNVNAMYTGYAIDNSVADGTYNSYSNSGALLAKSLPSNRKLCIQFGGVKSDLKNFVITLDTSTLNSDTSFDIPIDSVQLLIKDGVVQPAISANPRSVVQKSSYSTKVILGQVEKTVDRFYYSLEVKPNQTLKFTTPVVSSSPTIKFSCLDYADASYRGTPLPHAIRVSLANAKDGSNFTNYTVRVAESSLTPGANQSSILTFRAGELIKFPSDSSKYYNYSANGIALLPEINSPTQFKVSVTPVENTCFISNAYTEYLFTP